MTQQQLYAEIKKLVRKHYDNVHFHYSIRARNEGRFVIEISADTRKTK